jgi:hypothetical protein
MIKGFSTKVNYFHCVLFIFSDQIVLTNADFVYQLFLLNK